MSQAVVIGLSLLLGTGCLVQIERVSDPRAAFRQARHEASRYQGRSGPARTLNVLVYDRSERELVRVELPMWLCRKIEKHARDDGDADWDVDFDFGDHDRGERVKSRLKRHLRLRDIEKAGLGILVEVDEDGGDQVLVWLK